MSGFIRALLLFLFTFSIIAVSMIVIASVYMNSEPIEIDDKKNILVIGDSHTECAVNDSVFVRAANFSKSATAFVYSFAALKKLFSDNPHIDTVLLSYQPSSLSYDRERNLIFGESDMKRQVPYFLPFFSSSDLRLFLGKPPFYAVAMKMPKTALDYFLMSEENRKVWIDNNIGNFRSLTGSDFARDTAVAKPIDKFAKRDTVSQVTVNYIRKFEKFCAAKSITLILVNTPIFKYKTYINIDEFDDNRKTFFNDILFLDYGHFPTPDSGWFDKAHLNAVGARQFSKYLEANLARDIKLQNP